MTGYQIQRHRILLCVLALFCLGMALMGCKKASLDDWYATQADQFQEMTDAVNSQDLGYTLDIVTADSDALVFQYTLSKLCYVYSRVSQLFVSLGKCPTVMTLAIPTWVGITVPV